jgi:MoxR-like ATPase
MATEDSPSPKIPYPEWQNEYAAALVELDREKLAERVAASETAIFNRLQAISQSSDHHAERQAIKDALTALRVLKRESLGFPDWGRK